MKCLLNGRDQLGRWCGQHFDRHHDKDDVGLMGQFWKFDPDSFVQAASDPVSFDGRLNHLLTDDDRDARRLAARIDRIFAHEKARPCDFAVGIDESQAAVTMKPITS